MKKSTLWIICGVVSALVLGLIAWRVFTPPERELLKVCWTAQGEAVYTDIDDGTQGTCGDVQELKWNAKFPLAIALNAPKDALNDASVAVIEAAKQFNKFAGWDIFDTRWLVCEKGCQHNVTVVWSAPYEEGSNTAGSVSHVKKDGKMHAYVNIRVVHQPYAHAVVLHELGHVVGLSHAPAEDRINIMEATLPNFQDGNVDLGLGLRKLAPEDKKLLRDTYFSN